MAAHGQKTPTGPDTCSLLTRHDSLRNMRDHADFHVFVCNALPTRATFAPFATLRDPRSLQAVLLCSGCVSGLPV